jgi:UDP-N-acetylglucosamine--N-acetylmuramyl-(pentapeptide) pyrophosphoryl-undecaprenol N-acetylglucosamine transferase
MKILLVGGGTAGSVSPLLAVMEKIKLENLHAKFLFVGGKNGPEKLMAEYAKIKFVSISAGKWRRYFSLKNLVAPILVGAGFLQSLKILKEFKPNVVFGTGSFVQVPLIWAAKFLKIPVVLHQQDLIPSFANSLCQMAANKITVTFEDSLLDFSSGIGIFKKPILEKVVWTGNPFREDLRSFTKAQGLKYFGLRENMPTLLVLGGGTGAEFLNNLIFESLPVLTKTVQIIHSTGLGKIKNIKTENYRAFEFISEMGKAYASSDIVLCRAGLSTITELSNLEKVSIIVPIPDSHQEINAEFLAKYKASLTTRQQTLTSGILTSVIRKLLFEHNLQQDLKKNISQIMPKNSAKKIAKIILGLICKND